MKRHHVITAWHSVILDFQLHTLLYCTNREYFVDQGFFSIV